MDAKRGDSRRVEWGWKGDKESVLFGAHKSSPVPRKVRVARAAGGEGSEEI